LAVEELERVNPQFGQTSLMDTINANLARSKASEVIEEDIEELPEEIVEELPDELPDELPEEMIISRDNYEALFKILYAIADKIEKLENRDKTKHPSPKRWWEKLFKVR